MSLIILLFAVGLILLAAEVVVPGGILGGIAALMMLGGCAIAYSRFGSSGGAIASVTALVLIGITLFLEFYVLPKTRIGRRAFLDSEISATSGDTSISKMPSTANSPSPVSNRSPKISAISKPTASSTNMKM